MPSTTIEISREQRQPLHRLVTQHISGIGDVYPMIEQGDFATAERVRPKPNATDCLCGFGGKGARNGRLPKHWTWREPQSAHMSANFAMWERIFLIVVRRAARRRSRRVGGDKAASRGAPNRRKALR